MGNKNSKELNPRIVKNTDTNSKNNHHMKPAMSLMTMIIAISVSSLIAIFVFTYATNQGDKAISNSKTPFIIQGIERGAYAYKKEDPDAKEKYENINAEKVYENLEDENFSLTGAGSSSKLTYKGLTGVEIQIQGDKNGSVNNSNYKIIYDGSKRKIASNVSDIDAKRWEKDFRNKYKTSYPNAKFGGQSTTIGNANVNVAVSAPNSDMIFVIGGLGK